LLHRSASYLLKRAWQHAAAFITIGKKLGAESRGHLPVVLDAFAEILEGDEGVPLSSVYMDMVNAAYDGVEWGEEDEMSERYGGFDNQGDRVTINSLGGRRRIRTSVGYAGDFTDRSLWPLGHPPAERSLASGPPPARNRHLVVTRCARQFGHPGDAALSTHAKAAG
jgi:hypothetical protein